MTNLVPCLASALALGVAVSCVSDSGSGPGVEEPSEPAYRHRERASEFAGDGREDLVSGDLDGVPIGWFGPDEPTHPLAGGMWSAASMAIEEANARGGYEGESYRLLPAWSENPWGTGIADVTRLVYDDGVRALLGSPDGPSAHLVEQITAKARLVFVNPVSTDKSANLAGVPWIFSVAPGDHLIAPPFAGALIELAGDGPIAMISGTDHDSRLIARELLAALGERGTGPELHLEFQSDATTFEHQLEMLRDAAPAALAILAGPVDGGRFVRALREAESAVPMVGGPSFARRLFLETAGSAAEGVVFPLLWDRDSIGEEAGAFAIRFEARTGLVADHADAFTYDSVRLLLAAIETAGLNRVLIGDAVRELAPWPGVGGEIDWDRTGQNTRAVPLGVWRGGRRHRAGAGKQAETGR